MPDDPQRPVEIHNHIEASASGPIPQAASVVKAALGLPQQKAIMWAIILGVAALFYSVLWLFPAADERRRIAEERRDQTYRDAIIRAQEQEAERGREMMSRENAMNREMMSREGALNRQSREASDRIQIDNTKALLNLEHAVNKLTNKNEEELNQPTVPNRP
jgi:hypothetical protein